MPLPALGFALVAAVTSAGWNLLLKRSADPTAAAAVATLLGAVLMLPALVVAGVPAPSRPYVAASAAFEFAYLCLLAAAYRRAELSLIFPIARGTAPVLVLAASVAVLHARAGAGEYAGVLLVGAGAAAVRGRPAAAAGDAGLRDAGLRDAGLGDAGLGDAGLALAVACCVAGYTLIDKHGVALAEPVAYFDAVLLLVVAPYLAVAAATRGRASLRRELAARALGRNAVIGLAMAGGYDLVLEGLRLAAAAPVAAVREVSIVIGTGLAATVLHERVGRLRWVGACLVAVGVAVLAVAGG
jgi:drug/metabolite transporter (DMT)-like permease